MVTNGGEKQCFLSGGNGVYRSYVLSPFGPLELAADDHALLRCDRVEQPGLARPNGITEWAKRELSEYFCKKRADFTVPLVLDGTAFQKAVWQQLCLLPFGQTATYGQIARAMGKPGASRAVGSAVGANPLLIFLPCHRVLAAGNRLGGFSAGLDAKQALLTLEGISWR